MSLLHRPAWTNFLLAGLIGWTLWTGVSFFILSALRLLGSVGYLVSGLVFLVVLYVYFKSLLGGLHIPRIFPSSQKLYLPRLLWFVIAAAILVGSILHPPSNFDAYSYRIPRMLHWLADNRWHWIDGPDTRYDFMAPLWEITALPLLAFSRTDRLLFLPNFLCFLVLPGLIFKTFVQLGISPRTARLCMWVLPSGYGVILQAGSLGSDFMGAVFFLSSFHFLLCWSRNGCDQNFLLSCVTMGFATATKVSNLVYGIPWFLLFILNWHRAKQQRRVVIGSLFLGALFSYLPFGIWNLIHGCGFAVSKESAQSIAGGTPKLCFLGNSILLFVQNMVPPILPNASHVEKCIDIILPASIFIPLQHAFEGYFKLGIGELVIEDSAGLGLGVTGFIIMLFFIRLFSPISARKWGSIPLRLLGIGMVVATVVVCMKTCMISISRILLPAYIPLAAVLVNGNVVARLSTRKWVLVVACAAQLSGLCVLALNPAKPLIPVVEMASTLLSPSSPLLSRMKSVYSTFAGRSTALTPVAEALPLEAKVISFVCKDDTLEAGLWKPFGFRKIIPVKVKDSLASGFTFPTRFVVIQERGVLQNASLNIDNFIMKTGLIPLRKVSIIQQVSVGSENFTIAEVPGYLKSPHNLTPNSQNNFNSK